jgi:carbamoyl-phosphate synthase large subunit
VKCTILISSAGRRVELIRCFRDGAAQLGIDLRVIAVDVDPAMSAACQIADVAVPVPRCDRAEFIDDLLRICLRHGVDLIVPTIDPELEPLSAHAAPFGEIGVDVAIAAPEVVRRARDKPRTAHFLASRGVPAPRSGRVDEVIADPNAWRWPLMIKPRAGSGSVGIRVVSAPERLAPSWARTSGAAGTENRARAASCTSNRWPAHGVRRIAGRHWPVTACPSSGNR